MVAELALSMEIRQAMILVPGNVMSVGDRSVQVGEVEGIRWSEDRAAELGDVPSRRAEETAFPLECGSPPVLCRGKGDWCVLKTVGDITHGQVWVEADHFRDLEDVAGVGKAHDYPGDKNDGFRLGCELLSPSVNDSRSIPLASLSPGADRDQRMIQMLRDVV